MQNQQSDEVTRKVPVIEGLKMSPLEEKILFASNEITENRKLNSPENSLLKSEKEISKENSEHTDEEKGKFCLKSRTFSKKIQKHVKGISKRP